MSHIASDLASGAAADTGQGVGARLLRKEDDRFMRGRGQYVADIRLVGLRDVAFVRSPLAHARIKAIHVPEHYRDVVFTAADLTGIKPIKVTREISTARQCMSPLEGRGVVASFDHRLDQLTLYTGSQMPYIVRNGLSDCMGMDQGQIRIVSPDIGGRFGHKGILLPEEVCLAWLATRKGYTVRWIEDRREHLTASANCPEHDYKITGYADAD